MTVYKSKIRPPPPTGNTGFDTWAREIADVVNGMPHMSWFSGTTPNSLLTGSPGHLAVNLGSASTSTRLWIMGGTSDNTTLGWVTLRVGPA